MKKSSLGAVAFLLATGPLMAQPQANPAEMFMKQFDTDNSGGISLQEFLKPQEVQFKHMDQNGDGSISQQEAEDFVKQMQQHMMEQMKKNAPRQ